MIRDVLVKKLASLERYLKDLRPHAGKSAEEVRGDPYEIERLLELVVQVAVDILTHELTERGTTPDSYRDAFLRAGEEGLLPGDLAGRLADAAGLRNVLVHMYETIDYEIVATSVERALEEFGAFLDLYRDRLGDPETPLTHLVTGAAGFIGSHLAEALVEEGHAVRVLDDFSTGRRENLAPFRDRIELLEGSLTDPALCAEAVRGVDCVFHQAALPSVQRSVADPLPSHEANATGTLNLLIAAKDAGVPRFVYAASSSAYGDTEVLPKREEMTPRPHSPYAVAKLTGESYCAAFHVCYGLETVALRYFNIFGPRQDPTSPYSAVIPIFIDRALEGRPPLINGDGEQSRDFTYVANAVRANLLACRADAGGVAGEVFNVGCGERTTINGLWASLRGILGVDLEAEHAPPRPGDVRHSLASLEKISDRLGYEPSVGMDEGLRRTVAWFRENRRA